MIIQAIGTAAAVVLCVQYLDGFTAASLEYAIGAGIMIAAVYLILRPAAKLLTKPLGCLTFGLFGVVVDAALIELCSYVLGDRFQVASFVWAVAAALFIGLVRWLLGLLFAKD